MIGIGRKGRAKLAGSAPSAGTPTASGGARAARATLSAR
jgi:hypothetical protein